MASSGMQLSYPVSLWKTGHWHPEGIALISRHVDTGETLPESMLQSMLAAKISKAACKPCANWSLRYLIC